MFIYGIITPKPKVFEFNFFDLKPLVIILRKCEKVCSESSCFITFLYKITIKYSL